MKITITMRAVLRKYMPGEKKREVEVPEGTTCADALRVIGLNYEEEPNFGFVAVNGLRVMIDTVLQEGDELKAWSKVSGG